MKDQALTLNKTHSYKKTDWVDKIAIGASSVAAISGAIALGAFFSKEENRQKFGKSAQRGLEVLSDALKNIEIERNYQPVSHQISPRKKARKTPLKTP